MKRSTLEVYGASSPAGAISFREGDTHTFDLMFDTLVIRGGYGGTPSKLSYPSLIYLYLYLPNVETFSGKWIYSPLDSMK